MTGNICSTHHKRKLKLKMIVSLALALDFFFFFFFFFCCFDVFLWQQTNERTNVLWSPLGGVTEKNIQFFFFFLYSSFRVFIGTQFYYNFICPWNTIFFPLFFFCSSFWKWKVLMEILRIKRKVFVTRDNVGLSIKYKRVIHNSIVDFCRLLSIKFSQKILRVSSNDQNSFEDNDTNNNQIKLWKGWKGIKTS